MCGRHGSLRRHHRAYAKAARVTACRGAALRSREHAGAREERTSAWPGRERPTRSCGPYGRIGPRPPGLRHDRATGGRPGRGAAADLGRAARLRVLRGWHQRAHGRPAPRRRARVRAGAARGGGRLHARRVRQVHRRGGSRRQHAGTRGRPPAQRAVRRQARRRPRRGPDGPAAADGPGLEVPAGDRPAVSGQGRRRAVRADGHHRRATASGPGPRVPDRAGHPVARRRRAAPRRPAAAGARARAEPRRRGDRTDLAPPGGCCRTTKTCAPRPTVLNAGRKVALSSVRGRARPAPRSSPSPTGSGPV